MGKIRNKNSKIEQRPAKPVPPPEAPGRPVLGKAQDNELSALGIVKLTLGGLSCLFSLLFFAHIPLGGLVLLPFLFFGGVCLMVGFADEHGFYD